MIDIAERDPFFLAAAGANRQAEFGIRKDVGAPHRRPCLIDPDVAHNPIHPTVEARALLPLLAAAKRALYRHLAKVVSMGRMARQPGREPSQPWQERQYPLFKPLCQNSGLSWDETNGTGRFIPASSC